MSTVLNHSGHMLNGDLKNSMVFSDMRFIYTSKDVNSVIIERKTSIKNTLSAEQKSSLNVLL